MISAQHPRYNATGAVDLDVEHPDLGWIPFTASPTDPEPLGREIYARATAGEFGPVADHEPEPIDPARIAADRVAKVQGHLDAAARARGYDDIKTAVTYADEPAVPRFQLEGQAFRAWRSRVWQHCYQVLDDVTAGVRDIPTAEQLIAELPPLELPLIPAS